MTIIHTIEDLLHTLDDNPEWVEALRARLLSPELLNLPEKFAQFANEMNSFAAETNKFIAETNRFIAETNKFIAETKVFIAETNKFIAETKEFIVETKEFIVETKEFIVETKEFIVTTNKHFDSLETRMQSIQDDVGMLKGAHARNAALREAPFIADGLRLRWVKDLTPVDLWELTDRAPADIPTNQLRSFRRADLVAEATSLDNGETCYIAVEISFTANGRDTTRAQRNAAFLAQFTGRRTYAAVAGMRRDRRIEELIEAGEVFWYQLDPAILVAE